MTLPAGTQLGSLEIVRALGAGGMGEVYLAQDRELKRPIAIKVLPPDVTPDPHRVARFEQEARAASALNHPNVCVIHALGRTEDGRRYIAMEYVEGETLRERLVRGRVPLREALDVAIQIASALTAAHAAGIVHRDLKPENVMVRRDRLVKVLDFGLAKLAPSDAAAAAHEPTRTTYATEPGSLVGTTRYMAPEQARGGAADARADVWALGVVLYELVTGRPPFAGETRSDVLAAILERDPKSILEVEPLAPRELHRIVGKALRKDSEERYQVMKDLMLDLKALRDELLSGVAPPVGAPPRTSGGIRRFWPVGFALVAALVGGAAYWRASHGNRPAESPQAISVTGNYPYTRLTFGPGLQINPTFSPDGKFIAYASDRAGNFDIWVQPVAGGGTPVQITTAPEPDTQPDWSPDGSTLVFRSERGGGGLFLVPALGGPERRLTSFGEHAAWSEDGNEITFVDGAPGDVSAGTGLPMRAYVAALDGTPPREILTEFLRGGWWLWIAPHPGGALSVLGTHRSLGFGFFTVSRDGREVVESALMRLATDQDAIVRRFRWSPSGRMIYLEATVGAVRSLWRVRVEPTSLAWTAAERLTTSSGQDVAATVSRDNARVAFTTRHESSRLWVFPLDAVPGRLLGPGRPVTEEGALAASPALSPDGRTLVYTSNRPGIDRSELWAAPLDGGPGELLSVGGYSAAWARNGRRVAYTYMRRDKRPFEAATAIRTLGGTERFVIGWTRDFVFLPTDWTSDDHFLIGAYMSPMLIGRSQVVLWPTASPGTAPAQVLLATPDGRVYQGRVSPNGRWLSFVVHRDAEPRRLELAIAPAEGAPPSEWRRIVPDHIWPDKPRWSRDGRTLFGRNAGQQPGLCG
jgi:eukaryotic-like serine/threonine-protein kinase